MILRNNIILLVLTLNFVQLPLVAYGNGDCGFLFQKNIAARSFSFDIDDNILFMPTQIRVFHKLTGEEVGMSTADFAEARAHIGKDGKYKDYEMRPDPKTGSLRFFGDEVDGAQFYNDLKWVIENESPGKWQGPSWKAFQEAMSDYETASNTTFITARLHSPRSIFNGFKLLQERGYIKNMPREENIFPVSYPKFQNVIRFENIKNGQAADPSATKAEVMKALLDELNSLPVTDEVNIVSDSDGISRKRLRTWGFSDDDYGNYSKAVAVLTAEVAKGRWPNLKLVLFYTGHNGPILPEIKIIKSDGSLRDPKRAEMASEIKRRP
ncbi:MAG: hypothetical protein A4S09_01040 [Proteobacteria bacterium SG_bin7]|nr:MAG: hypothetical protein A4S09_01040 [Proteobacteria bacterium SG_bin7]